MRNAALKAWLAIPAQISSVVDGLKDADLDRRGGNEGMSIRETVHHLVEANLVAATIIIAAMGKPGTTYDWTWLYPDRRWNRALGYARVEIEPALSTLRALVEHIAAILHANRDAMKRTVKLSDAPGDEPYSKTIEDVLRDEAAHAKEHLAAAKKIRGRKK